MFPTLIGIISITFIIIQFVPGGPIDQMKSLLRGHSGVLGEAGGSALDRGRKSNDFDSEQLIQLLMQTKVIAIGPFTADELQKFHVENIIANVHTIKGSVDAVLEAFSLA